MYTGNPNPLGELKILLEKKRNVPSNTCEVVADAARWVKAQLTGAEIDFRYSACDDQDHYGFGVFVVTRYAGETPFHLEIKISEIADRPFAFADVFSVRRGDEIGFPFFTSLDDEEGRDLLLNYLSDFLLSTAMTGN